MEKTSKNFKSWRKTKKVIGNYWKILPNLDKTQFESWRNVQKSDKNSEQFGNWKILPNLDKTQFESWKNVQKSEKMMENWKMLLNLDKTQFESWKKCPKF